MEFHPIRCSFFVVEWLQDHQKGHSGSRKKVSLDAPTSHQAGPSEEWSLSFKEWDKWFENSSDSKDDSDHN